MRLVVGLGNPGERYRRTRHNAGFLAVDLLAARAGASGRLEPDVWTAEARLAGQEVLLVRPLSYMNLSGRPVARLLARAEARPADLVVIVDDVALELGRVRVRERGSHGGHNGLRSLADELGGCDFPRVRIGVRDAELPDDLAEYVLGEFPQELAPLVERSVALAADATECLLAEGPAVAMNRFNGQKATLPVDPGDTRGRPGTPVA
jgi:PTH1 family peptidyl-tRNA hydrolase